ncbi:FAD:protein FMN transferase [Primorskyibacter sp. 2E233]|uniref:FAD:protein FMN transferase n=1 Tax=Primorskyibacter sp. 2E233 TaxID=3413431 RepID=UPI003BF44830
MTLTRRTFTTLTGAAGLSTLCGAGLAQAPSGAQVDELSGRAFGTTWRVVLPAGADLHAIRPEITAILNEVDRQMSPWRGDSEISRFNRAAPGQYRLPSETLLVTRSALRIARMSGGAFDPTVGPLVARWGFGVIEGDSHPDWTSLMVSETSLAKTHAGCTLDLCGIAKGFALDRLAQRFRADGIDNFLVDIGGELLAAGRHPAGRPWRSGIEDPRPGTGGFAGVVELPDLTIATSGLRWNAVRFSDRSWSHIIEPSARRPVGDTLASVSVIATTAMMADGWATALMAAGPRRGPDLAREHGISALFLIPQGGALRRVSTGAFDAHVLT